MTALLRVNDLNVAYGKVQALRGVTLEVAAGEMVALLGPNGAGKTTTLRAISGMVPPSGGSIVFDGEPIGGLSAHRVVARGIAHLPEGRELFPSLSVIDNLRLGGWSRRGERGGFEERRDRVLGYFPRLEQRVHQAAGSLSGGEQQMLVVARALMSAPRLLLADELSLGLAPQIVDLLFEILRNINREGTAVLLVEQFVHKALEHSDRAYVLAKGEVRLEGHSAELREDRDLLASYLGDAEPVLAAEGAD
jgi:branched-chain amino acid transport system ATP-binding protein